MRSHACFWFAAAITLGLQISVLNAQSSSPSLKLSLGTSQSAVATTYGKPFEKWNLKDTEYSAQVGVPTGLWEVYHLTASKDRMYVTMLHFGSAKNEPQHVASISVDSLMLMPNGHWTVSQILSDQPEFAPLCRTICNVVRATNGSGKIALLLEPQTVQSDSDILYFEGDSATISWKAVSSLQDSPSWIYVFRLRDFDDHHIDYKREVIGTWSSQTAPHK